jgi:hypothetical protein
VCAQNLDESKKRRREWIQESFELTQIVTYAEPVATGEVPVTLSDDDKRKAPATAKQRVALAGAGVAKLLEVALQ